MEYTPEMLAQLEAQRAYFSGDDHIRREVEPWLDSTPEERLAELDEMWKDAEYFLATSGERDESPAPLEARYPPDTLEILRTLRTASK